MQKQTFNDYVAKVPAPKQLTPETVLPYVFDLLWDIKTFKELSKTRITPQQIRLLAESGFDTREINAN